MWDKICLFCRVEWLVRMEESGLKFTLVMGATS